MSRIYLIVWPDRAAVVVVRRLEDIDLEHLRPDAVYEVGMADPLTPPGPLLCGLSVELSRFRPRGRLVYTALRTESGEMIEP